MKKENNWFFDKFDNAVENHPFRTLVTAWVIGAIISIICWLIIIVGAVVAVKLVF